MRDFDSRISTFRKAATITSASLIFNADAGETESSMLSIRAENTDNSATFSSTAFGITGRPVTTESVAWSPGAWTNGVEYQSPDLSALVQEVVDRAGWAEGNSLAFIIDGTGTRTSLSFDGDAAKACAITR